MIRKLLWWCLAFFALALLGGIWAVESAGLSPRQLAPYIEGRSAGHAPWVEASGRYVAQSMLLLNRGLQAPANAYPAWAGGHRNSAATNSGRILVVGDEVAALEAIARAEPGDVITLLPGDYRFDGSSPLSLTRAGRADAPITLRANTLGEVQLVFDLLEGFHVQSPYWRFENLSIRGVCAKDDDCEHAFHITGKAHHTLIRNSRIEDFNAHIKINGSAGAFRNISAVWLDVRSDERTRRLSRVGFRCVLSTVVQGVVLVYR